MRQAVFATRLAAACRALAAGLPHIDIASPHGPPPPCIFPLFYEGTPASAPSLPRRGPLAVPCRFNDFNDLAIPCRACGNLLAALAVVIDFVEENIRQALFSTGLAVACRTLAVCFFGWATQSHSGSYQWSLERRRSEADHADKKISRTVLNSKIRKTKSMTPAPDGSAPREVARP